MKVLVAGLFAVLTIGSAHAQLSGQVHSDKEGAMEGVLVSAHRDGGNMSVTVVSDVHGHYAFPADRLAPGHYALSTRAVGFDLAGPATTDVPGTADLTLKSTANLAAQLTNAEWLESLPGGTAQKQFLQNCTNCHSLQKPLFSAHTAAEFDAVQHRMTGYAAASSILTPQLLVADRVANQGEFALEQRKATIAQQAAYLASVNFGDAQKWRFPLKTFHRPTGRAT